MKKVLSSIFVLAMLFTAQGCDSSGNIDPNQVDELLRILTSSDSWMVVEARFGNEDAPMNMYQGYRIKFIRGDRSSGTYTVTRPNASAINLNRSNPNNFGTFKTDASGNVRMLIVDEAVNIQVISTPSTSQMELQWTVTVPGKSATDYYWKLRAVN